MKRLSEIVSTSGVKKTALVLIFIAALCVFAYTQFQPSQQGSTEAKADVVAIVQMVEKDVRQRPVEEASWYRAEPQTEIQRGDAVYSGQASRSRVQMKSGGVLELGEETLVIFDDVDGVTVPDVSRGQVKLKINGQMKIAISGEVTEFSGAQSELVLNSTGGVRKIQVVKGQAAIKQVGSAKRSIAFGETMELAPVKKDAKPMKITAPTATEAVSQDSITTKRKVEKEVVRNTAAETAPVVEAPVLPPVVEPVVTEVSIAPVVVPPAPAVEVPAPPVVSTVETAPPVEAPVVAKEALSVAEPLLNINRVMKVQEVYQRKGTALLVPRTGLKFLKVPVSLSWNGAAADEKVLVQVSKDASFKQPWLEREANGSNVVVEQWKTGKSFWRISRDRQTWSSGGEVTVKPSISISQNPSLSVLKNKVVVFAKGKGPEAQAKLKFEDSGLSKPRGWVLQGSSSADFPASKSKTVLVSKSRIDVPLHRPGRYFFRVRSVASAGEISTFSAPIEVQAMKGAAPPAPVPLRMAKRLPEKTREVAAVEPEPLVEPMVKDDEFSAPAARSNAKIKMKVEEDKERLRPWRVTIEGGETALVSSEQLGVSADAASIHMVGLRGGYYDSKNSANIGYRAQFGAANAEGNSQSNSRLEARYTRWWQSPWQPLRLGWLGGFDRYRNAGSSRFSKGYDAAKTGLDVGVSFTDRWKGGGNFLLGAWTDSNRVYELGGFVSYEFSRELAFGLGYRLSLFEAGTAASAAVTLPYREAMGEAYSALQFSF